MQYDTTDFVETNGEATMKLIARTRRLTREYYMTDHEDAERRRAILEELLGEIGKNVEIDTPFYCDYGKNIHIGSDVIINMNCTFVDNKPIRIGSKVLIASNVQIYTSYHPFCLRNGCVWTETRRKSPSSAPTPCRWKYRTTYGSAAESSFCPASPSGKTASSEPEASCPARFRPTA